MSAAATLLLNCSRKRFHQLAAVLLLVWFERSETFCLCDSQPTNGSEGGYIIRSSSLIKTCREAGTGQRDGGDGVEGGVGQRDGTEGQGGGSG